MRRLCIFNKNKNVVSSKDIINVAACSPFQASDLLKSVQRMQANGFNISLVKLKEFENYASVNGFSIKRATDTVIASNSLDFELLANLFKKSEFAKTDVLYWTGIDL